LALDRKSFIDILAEGQDDIGGAAGGSPAVTISSRSMHASSAACAAMSDNVLAMTRVSTIRFSPST
jgi:hypothetical protein